MDKRAHTKKPPNADLGETLNSLLAEIEPYKQKGSESAADDVELLVAMLSSWRAYKAGSRRECLERFADSVQHDSPLQLHPRTDPPFYAFLVSALQEASSLSVDPATAAAATAYLCVSDPRAMLLEEAEAGATLDALAAQHPGSWWVQYARATWRVLRGDSRTSAEALTRAILAGGPCGMYYSRARIYSNLERTAQAGRDYAKFLELAPPDHRSVPDAHYALALDAAAAEDDATAQRHFAEGQAAEGRVAPWVGYKDSQAKITVQMLLSLSGGRGGAAPVWDFRQQ